MQTTSTNLKSHGIFDRASLRHEIPSPPSEYDQASKGPIKRVQRHCSSPPCTKAEQIFITAKHDKVANSDTILDPAQRRSKHFIRLDTTSQ